MNRLVALVLAGVLVVPVLAQSEESRRCECREIAKPHTKLDHGAKEGPKKPIENGERPGLKCGKDAGATYDDLNRRFPGLNRDDLSREVKEHFKQTHPDGVCHCLCPHVDVKKAPEAGDRPKCGKEPGQVYDESFKKKPDTTREEVKEHFRKLHPDGVCHCSCGHKEGGGEKPAVRKPDGGEKPGIRKPEGGERPGPKREGVKSCSCREKHEGPCPKGNNGVGNGRDPQPPGHPPVNDGPGTAPGYPGNRK